MGIYSHGELFFGVSYGEEDPRWPLTENGYREAPEDWESEDSDWESWLARQAGLDDPYTDPVVETMPQMDYSSRDYAGRQRQYQEARETWYQEHADWVARRDQFRKAKQTLIDECPVTLADTGDRSEGWSVYHLVINGSQCSGDASGDPVPEGHFAKVTPEAIERAGAWCAERGIHWPNPHWILAGSRG